MTYVIALPCVDLEARARIGAAKTGALSFDRPLIAPLAPQRDAA